MRGISFTLGGWRAWLLGAAVTLLLVVVLLSAGLILLIALSVGVVAAVGYRLLARLGLVRRGPTEPRAGGSVIDASYRIVDQRRLPEQGMRDEG